MKRKWNLGRKLPSYGENGYEESLSRYDGDGKLKSYLLRKFASKIDDSFVSRLKASGCLHSSLVSGIGFLS